MPNITKKELSFTKGVERLIDPIEVGSIHFLYGLNKLLPIQLQQKLSENSSKKYPYLGFVVEPYSSFLFYEVKDINWAESLLPDGFRLIKTKVLGNDTSKYYAVFGVFTAHTSAFWGSRIEFYLIAENEDTGLLSWVIIDYDSNTIGQDKKNGLKGPSIDKAVITTNHQGMLLVDANNSKINRKLEYAFNINDGEVSRLDPRLWIEGNLSVTYGKQLKGSQKTVFSLHFEIQEMEKALRIPNEKVSIISNSWFTGLYQDKPEIVLCFPYAQHYLSDSPGHKSHINNAKELSLALERLNFNKIKPFSVKPLRNLILLQNVVTTGLFILVVILLYLLLKK